MDSVNAIKDFVEVRPIQSELGRRMLLSYDLFGKTAVVTGGARGIGRAVARRLKNAGASAWVWDISPAQDDGVNFQSVDVTQPDQIESALSEVIDIAHSIDILVNNAGYLGDPVAVEQLRPEVWRRVFDVNLTGVFETSRRVVPHMRRTGWGRIVNLASVAGKEGFPNLSAYSSASAGVIAFTKSLGKELADTQIRVNCIAPTSR